MARGRKQLSLEEKINSLDQHFVDEVAGLSPELLKDKLAKLVGHEQEIKQTQKDDEELKALEDQVKSAKMTYTEPLKAIKLKKELLVRMLKDQGKL